MLAKQLQGAALATIPQYIEDVFSTYLYTGNGSTQTITNNIDLSTKGGMLWIKQRNGTRWNVVTDTVRGINSTLFTNDSRAIEAYDHVTAFNANGFGIKDVEVNGSGSTYASWTFRKQAKFFDVVTYTGNGSNRTIAHSLGSVPGCIIVKRTSSAKDWAVYHRGIGNTKYLTLNSTADAATVSTYWNNTDPTSTVFTVGTDGDVNTNGETYVAYLFAHDAGGFGATGSDNVITCGTFTGASGTGIFTVDLGYEPQWILTKSIDNAANNWGLRDTMRGFNVSDAQVLSANTSSAETSSSTAIQITNTGFKGSGSAFDNSTFIYIAIRRGPMKTPTSGTSVFAINTAGAVTPPPDYYSGFPVDLGFSRSINTTSSWFAYDRLRGDGYLLFNTTDSETATVVKKFDFQSGYFDSTNVNANAYGWMFRRAPGFFDVVCYTGNGSARTISHNLGVAPDLMIMKRRDDSSNWRVYAAAIGNTKNLELNSDLASATASSVWNDTSPTASVFTVGTNINVNGNTYTYVAYLFASVTGVSKVGSYTGNGSNQTINCGFTAGARFVMIKRTDSTGDWYVYDTARGIVSGNDPQLKLNSTAAEATGYDAIDPDNSGFIVNNDATNFPINVNNATYIYLAIA